MSPDSDAIMDNTPFELPSEVEAALDANSARARSDRARIGCDLLATLPDEYRQLAMESLLALEVGIGLQLCQTVESMRLIARHAHDEGRKVGEQYAETALRRYTPDITH